MQALRLITADEQRPSLALELPEMTTFDEWVSIGRRLCLGSQALQWHIGDWWAFGDHRYGDRAKAAAEGLFGREFGSLMNLASVARAFETSRRGEVLSWTHYREVVALQPPEADALLEKAEREHLSTRELRREVAALKAANDPEPGPTPDPQPLTPQSDKAQSILFAEDVVELAEALQKVQPLTRRQSDRLANALAFITRARGRRNTFKVPDNFPIIFVEKGRVECETTFGVARSTVSHWLILCGKGKLLQLRADFVKHGRAASLQSANAEPVKFDTDDPMYLVAKEAAHYLRISRYGGWRISPTNDGNWFVGTVRKTNDELIAMAERQGFDSEAARRECDGE